MSGWGTIVQSLGLRICVCAWEVVKWTYVEFWIKSVMLLVVYNFFNGRSKM